MIEKLKRKVFRSIFFSAAGVLFVILLALNLMNVGQMIQKERSVMDSAQSMLFSEKKEKDRGRNGEKGKPDLLRSVSEDELVIARLDEGGNISDIQGFSDSGDEDLIDAALEKAGEKPEGKLGSWRYRLEKDALVMLNTSSFSRETAEVALWSAAGFCAACLLFALLAHFLAERIVKPADEAMQAQRRFIADASHELKTPLTVIDANAAVLEKQVGQSKWLDYIKDESERMAGLVNALLRLSGIEEESEKSLPESLLFDAAEIVMESSLPFESVAFERGLTLETDLPDSLMLKGRAEDLGQLVGILVDNAIKHASPDTAVRLVMESGTIRHGRKEERQTAVRVTNTGNPIPSDALPH
ncbi:MAG: HAMP domain-containing histidine kinase, partial [Clostridia bacterium]|nr:HAMP domain-containing histidine kinase [Clostridia bacterium]